MDEDPVVIDVAEQPAAVVRGVVRPEELRDFFDRAFGELGSRVAAREGLVAGPAFAAYARPPGETVELAVGFPVTGPVEAAGDVVAGALPGGRVVRLVHRGGYDELGASWERLAAWADARGLRRADALWEVYLTEPTPDGDPADMRTELSWLLAST